MPVIFLKANAMLKRRKFRLPNGRLGPGFAGGYAEASEPSLPKKSAEIRVICGFFSLCLCASVAKGSFGFESFPLHW
jgi:hypothetical protein